MMKPPIVYYGGKIRLAPWIVEVMKRYEFQRYIEPFGGGAAVLFAKEPSQCEVYNDIYSDVVNLYRILQDPYQYEQLSRLIESSPYSREIYCDSRLALEEENTSKVERARAFFISTSWETVNNHSEFRTEIKEETSWNRSFTDVNIHKVPVQIQTLVTTEIRAASGTY